MDRRNINRMNVEMGLRPCSSFSGNSLIDISLPVHDADPTTKFTEALLV